MDPWRTGIVDADDTHIRVRGYDIADLMRGAGFVETVFLLHRGRRPTTSERTLLDALLVAVADHGPGAPSCAAARLAASGNRQSISAAVAAGVLAIGNEHGGAAEPLMALMLDAMSSAGTADGAIEGAAAKAFARARDRQTRIPGLGHRSHTVDPRVSVLFDLAAETGMAGAGIRFVKGLETAARAAGAAWPINIDGAVAALLHDLGFPPSAGKFIFIIGRVAGITAEVAEEYAREKAMRVRIPVEYDGDPPRTLNQKD